MSLADWSSSSLCCGTYPTIDTMTKGEEAMARVMKVTSGDLKRAFEVNDQARIALITSMIAYRDTLEDLGRQLQLCARR